MFFMTTRRPQTSPLLPYTTLFRPRVARPEHEVQDRDLEDRVIHDEADRPPRRRGRSASSWIDRKSTRLNSSHLGSSYAVFCLKKKKTSSTIPRHSVLITIEHL